MHGVKMRYEQDGDGSLRVQVSVSGGNVLNREVFKQLVRKMRFQICLTQLAEVDKIPHASFSSLSSRFSMRSAAHFEQRYSLFRDTVSSA